MSTSMSCGASSRAPRCSTTASSSRTAQSFTSAGVTAGLDLALHVIGRQLGPRVAAEIARDLVVYLRRAGTDPALSPWVMHRNHLHPAVHRVQDAVAREPTARWSARELSAVACTSPRNLVAAVCRARAAALPTTTCS